MNRPLLLLALCQGFFLTNNVVFIAINGLVGLQLAPLGWMATLPVTGYVVGSALSAGLVAKTQSQFGRKRSFQFGLIVAALSAALCAYAAVTKNFWLLVAATVVAGYYNANAALYRLPDPNWSRRNTRSARSRSCWRAASSARSPGRTWPVPRARCSTCRLPQPTCRWWGWRCCRSPCCR